MSSGTQIELDMLGADAGQGGAATPPASGANGGTGAGVYPTDEEILGIDPPAGCAQDSRETSASAAPETRGARLGMTRLRRTAAPALQGTQHRRCNTMPEWMQSLAGDPKHGAEAQQLWQEHQAFRAAFSSPDEARAIKELFPGGAQEARTLKQAAQAVDQLDAAIYSGDARAQSEVVAELARANPAAFRQLFAEAAKVLGNLPAAQRLGGKHPRAEARRLRRHGSARQREFASSRSASHRTTFRTGAAISIRRRTRRLSARPTMLWRATFERRSAIRLRACCPRAWRKARPAASATISSTKFTARSPRIARFPSRWATCCAQRGGLARRNNSASRRCSQDARSSLCRAWRAA